MLKNRSDRLVLEKIRTEFLKYDYIDVVSKISLLSTLCKNQDSNSLFASLLNVLIDDVNEDAKPAIPMKHFASIINELEQLSIVKYIDPVENLFFDIVSVDKQYLSYEGINSNPSFILNNLIIAIELLKEKDVYSDFCAKALAITRFILQIETNIITASNEVNPLNRNYNREIYFYELGYYSRMKDYVLLSYQTCRRETFGEIDDFIVSKSDKRLFVAPNEAYSYYGKPFLKIADKLLILDPTLLTVACTHRILMLAKRYGVLSELIAMYKMIIVEDVRQSIIKIDNPHNVFQIESKYKRFNYLVEEFSNTRAMLHIFVSDDEDTYTDTAVCQNENKRPILIDRYVKEVVKKLKNNVSVKNTTLPCCSITTVKKSPGLTKATLKSLYKALFSDF